MSFQSNPFDYSSPVRDPETLAGRETELNEATYYLEQARSGSSYSIALIGKRASGKTSMLNVLESRAADLDLLAAQVALDEVVTGTELDFFREVFEALMTSAATSGMFGGLSGDRYRKFMDQIELFDESSSPGAEPLGFGRMYAVAKANDREVRPGRRRLQMDFEILLEEARSHDRQGVVLLLDECDLLGQQRGLLQALRNLLQSTPGLACVMAGTEAMFPVIEDVFSPIPRQFTRINVGNFNTWRDTKSAVDARLSDDEYEWAKPDSTVAREIHRVTRGSPYEVMLVSHFAFRESVEAEERHSLHLTANALEGVARQLEQQDPSLHQAVRTVRALTNIESMLLGRAVALNGVTLRDLALSQLAFQRAPEEPVVAELAEKFRGLLEPAVKTGFVEIDVDGKLSVQASEFERLYIRYSTNLSYFQGEAELDELRHPSVVLAEKAAEFLAASLASVLKTEVALLSDGIMGINGDYEYPLFDAEVPPTVYQLRCSVPLDNGFERTALVWVPTEPSRRDEVDRAFRAVLDDSEEVFAQLGIETGEPVTEEINATGLMSAWRLNRLQESDIGVELTDLIRLFLDDDPEWEDNLKQLYTRIGNEELPIEPELRSKILNDIAFMSLAIGDTSLYEELYERASSEVRSDAPFLELSNALYLAASGQFDDAEKHMQSAKEWLDRCPESDAIMFGPQVLIRRSRTPVVADLVQVEELGDVYEVYGAAIEAAREGASVAEAIARLEGRPPWMETLVTALRELEALG